MRSLTRKVDRRTLLSVGRKPVPSIGVDDVLAVVRRSVPTWRGRIRLTISVAAVLIGAVITLPQPASAATVSNDNYLSSWVIPDAQFIPRFRPVPEVTRTIAEDTTGTTTQPDLFNPNKQGLAFGGMTFTRMCRWGCN